MRASEFAEDMFGVEQRRPARKGARHSRGHKPVERYHKKHDDSNEEQLDELQFLGSQCTKDCSGHQAGYAWYKQNGYEPASWSDSFNKGAALAHAGR